MSLSSFKIIFLQIVLHLVMFIIKVDNSVLKTEYNF